MYDCCNVYDLYVWSVNVSTCTLKRVSLDEMNKVYRIVSSYCTVIIHYHLLIICIVLLLSIIIYWLFLFSSTISSRIVKIPMAFILALVTRVARFAPHTLVLGITTFSMDSTSPVFDQAAMQTSATMIIPITKPIVRDTTSTEAVL